MIKQKVQRKYMQIAFQEMLKSKDEHQRKYDPMVGAVIVDKNGIELSRSHRGELRIGEHAEFSIIERKLQNTNLEGSILYVTLEPCSGAVRSEPKEPCTKRIISARISHVVIGIPDPNPDIEGKGITYLRESGVGVSFFDADLASKIREENEKYLNDLKKNPEKYIRKIKKVLHPSDKEKEAVKNASVMLTL